MMFRGGCMGLYWLGWLLVARIPVKKKCGAEQQMLA